MPDIQQLLDESAGKAQPALSSLFGQPGRAMTADEFRETFRAIRLFAMATTGASGGPHIAPVHVQLRDGDKFEMTIQEESVRWRDIQRDPRVAFTGWAEGGKTIILYGTAHEVANTRRQSTAGGRTKPALTLRIEPTRIHAMDPRREE